MTTQYWHPIEARIARFTIRTMLAAGFSVSVNDGEEITVRKSRKAREIAAAMNSTDEDYLIIHREGEQNGWIRFVYGNEPEVVICDYTTSLEPQMIAVNAYAEKFEGRS